MTDSELTLPVRIIGKADLPAMLDREWLVTNGLGGYASGTIVGVATRRYHGLLVAALPAPLGRFMMFNHLSESLRLPDGSTFRFGGMEYADRSFDEHGCDYLIEFRLEAGLPVWLYKLDSCLIEKRVFLPHLQNTVFVTYRLLEGKGEAVLRLRPALHFRGHDHPVSPEKTEPYVLTASEDRYEFSAGHDLPRLRFLLEGAQSAFTLRDREIPNILYRTEESRGYDSRGSLWSPGEFSVTLRVGEEAALIASTEKWETIRALPARQALDAEVERRRRLFLSAHPAARTGLAGELIVAADQFLVLPAGRIQDEAWAHAAGDEVRSIIAGYHWFTDWGRDTMISLEGLTLTTGRQIEAGYILRTFAYYVRDGLIPNLFPEGACEGLYHTADATLWFFHALHRYLEATGDRETLRVLLPKLRDIVDHHIRGTRFGIGVDPRDGLLRQGAAGYQLTWMDAKVGDWVVTPRRGKAVEINGLWYNALRLLENWERQEGNDAAAQALAKQAEKAQKSFNERFWYAEGKYLYDVVDGENGDDASCRPNQLLAMSLEHPVLAPAHWATVVQVVQERLLTPVGLRTLAPGSPDFKAKYFGNLRARDAAYHQGTVWGWLLGPFVDAWMRVHPDHNGEARVFLEGLSKHLSEACIGTISEIFDADPPYTPRGCIAQAWSVAETLRCWVKVGGGTKGPQKKEG